MPSYWSLLLGYILLLVVIILVLKKIFPGISYTALKKLKLNADAVGSIPNLTLSINKTGIILAVHSIPQDYPGHCNYECNGRNWCEFIHQEFHQDFINAVERAVFSGTLHSFQYSVKTDAGFRWFECELIRISENSLLLVSKDFTEKKITREKLDVAHHSERMTTFIIDIDSKTITFDRKNYISKWSGRKIPKVMKIDEAIKLVSLSDAGKLTEALEQVMAGVEHVPVVNVQLHNDLGLEPDWVSVRGYVAEGNSSSTSSTTILGVVRYITRYIRAENQLKNLNFMLKNVLDTIPVGLYWKDENLKYQGASRVFLSDNGLHSEDYRDENVWITDKSEQIERQVIESGRPVLNCQEKVSLPGAVDKRVNISRVPLRSPSGSITGLMVTYTDVTENTQFRDQLIRRKEFLSRLVENLPVGFFAKDPSQGMTYRIWNREMEEIFGFPASEAVEQRDWNLFGSETAAMLKNDDDELLKNPDSGKTPKIYKLHGRSGLKTVSMVRVLLYDDLLDSTLVAGVVDDISRENELEDQLRQSQKMEAIGRLAGGVAHDFNNLLQVMMGSAELGASDISSAGKSFNQILQAGKKAMFLTRQLLSFSRDESFNRIVFAVDHRVGEFVRMVHRIIGANAKLEFFAGAPGAQIHGDPFQLEQVLMNLLVNARDAIPEGRDGLINVTTSILKMSCFAGSEPVECAVISVSDTGEGIPEDIIDKIFEPFFTTKAQGKGTGLGLASSYGIVAKHNGVILVESTLDEGTRFNVCIPLHSGGLEKAIETKSRKTQSELFSPITILLAEDEEMVREIARTVLETAGHSVIEARDGGEAVKLFQENRGVIDMLVFDAIMPVISGSEAFRKIHSIDPGIPVLFCTGYSRDTLIKSFTGQEITGVLQKPYAAADLLEAVKSLIKRIDQSQ